MQKAITTGVTAKTPGNLFLGPGTIHNGLKYDYDYTVTSDETVQSGKTYYTKSGSTYTPTSLDVGDSITATLYERSASGLWNFAETIIGATNGLKLSIKPNIKKVEADGMLVAVKGMYLKRGEEAKLEGSVIELTPGLICQTVFAEVKESEVPDFTLIESRETIEEGDYYTNFAYVGTLKDGSPVIVIFDYAICTSGIEVEGKNVDNAVMKVTIECCAEIGDSLEKLPYHIYYPEDENDG